MKNIINLLSLIFFASCATPPPPQTVITSDITNFWQAYDQITATSDSTEQLRLLQELYIEKATPGLKAFMERRQYTPEGYLNTINQAPRFWESVRANTLEADKYAQEISQEVEKLRSIYPDLKPAKIYFTIGGLMSPGTTMDSLVLIGAELAMADSTVVTDELPEWLANNLRVFFDGNPIEDVVLLNVHEYVHTQQSTHGYDLLSQSMYEGVAEFVSSISTETPSQTPAVSFGKENEAQVKARFTQEMFSQNWDDWLYNNFDNEFSMRDLGYYVGYAVAESYYEKQSDQKQAIKTLIELDFGSKEDVETFVEETGFFNIPLSQIGEAYEANRPEVTGILELENGGNNIDPSMEEITIRFSRKMNNRFGRFDFGTLGEDSALPITSYNGMSADSMGFIYGVKLEPNQRYQRVLTPIFRAIDGAALKPYTIDFQTGGE